MQWHKFHEGDQPEILTSISAECQGGRCAECPGVFQIEDYEDQTIFCVHECHKVQKAQ